MTNLKNIETAHLSMVVQAKIDGILTKFKMPEDYSRVM